MTLLESAQRLERISAVKHYFERLESKWGYNFFLGGVKHFGFYPTGKMDIPERKAQELMQDLLASKLELKPGQLVLDAGCGQGIVATYLAQKYGVKTFGISITPFEIEKAKKLVKKLKLEDRCTFKVMDYTQTNFPNDYFDALFTLESLVHAYNLEAVLCEFLRVLKPGGKIAHFEYSIAPEKDLKERIKLTEQQIALVEWVIKGGVMWSLKKMEHGKLPSFLTQAGFTNIQEENISLNVLPTAKRLHRIAIIPYQIIRVFKLQNYFFNTTVAAEAFPLWFTDLNLTHYNITTAKKSAQD